MGSIVLPHLQTAWHVDQAILSEEERLVVIRFGRDHDPDCKYHLDPLPRSRTNRFPQVSAKMSSFTKSLSG